MKKTFKRAGVAVLSMAMLLSMGAVGTMTASAAGEKIVVATTTNLAAGDAVKVYKVGSSSATGWAWTNAAYATATGLQKPSDVNDTNKGRAAAVLARTVSGTPDARGVVGSDIDVSGTGLGKGYYLVIAAPADAGKVAQPMLIEVEDGATATVSDVKVGSITLNKTITQVSTDGTAANAKVNHIDANGKNAQAASGDVVSYRLVAQIPTYDADATSIQDFVLTDVSDSTLTSCASADFSVFIADTADAATGTNAKTYLTRTDGQNFTVTLSGGNGSGNASPSVVASNAGKYLIVEFTATVGDDPTISKNLGARANQADATNSADANKNDVTLTYGNNYSTGGGSDTDGDGDIDTDDDTPLKDYADVYVTALRINKTMGTTAAAPADGEVGFTLYAEDGTTVVRSQLTTVRGKVNFLGLDAGTYVLKETKTPGGYKKADNITVTISSSAPYAAFSVDAPSGFKADATNGGFEKTVNNPSLEQLPGTGGIGTIIFTAGGAAIVLLAGILFVIYMRKRKEEV